MSISRSLLQRGIALAQVGKLDDARLVLTAVIEEESENKAAWQWYMKTFQTNIERAEACRRWLQYEPFNLSARAEMKKAASRFKTDGFLSKRLWAGFNLP